MGRRTDGCSGHLYWAFGWLVCALTSSRSRRWSVVLDGGGRVNTRLAAQSDVVDDGWIHRGCRSAVGLHLE